MASKLEIPVQEVQRRLSADNPWWRAGVGIDREESAWPRRAYFPHFCRLALETRVRRAVVLIGPRRVGKTVMLNHFIQALLDDGLEGVRVLNLSLDTPLYSGRSLERLVRLFMDQHHHDTNLMHSLHYARWKVGRQDLEVDIVSLDPPTQRPRFAVEIKWSDCPPSEPQSLRGIREFAARYPLIRSPLLTTRTDTGQMDIEGVAIEFVPVALHCYTIARNLLKVRA